MGPDDTLRLADWVSGLFTETTPQQVAFLADQFAPFDVDVVEAEVARYRRHTETLNIANLLRRLTDEQAKKNLRAAPPPRAARREVDRQWERDDAAIARLSDAELARHKEAVLEHNPDLRRFLADKNPRDSLVLRSLILDQRLKQASR
jgi:hypothetical protein